jgi:phage-related protein
VRRVPAADEKPLYWVGSSKRDFLSFPVAVKEDMGNALGIAQFGGTAPTAKPWKGLGPGVLEIVESHDGNAYRAVYTVRFEKAVYILHAFQKKSPSGIRNGQTKCRSCCRTLESRRERLRGALWQAETLNGENRSLVAPETCSRISGFPTLPSARPSCD